MRGLSRSGGTLLVTLLDSHPEIAMSYELYPTVFDISLTREYALELALDLEHGRFKKSATNVVIPGFTKFILRAERSGIANHKLSELMVKHLIGYSDFKSQKSRFEFIASCCRSKMYDESKSLWGSKCTNNYYEYLEIWPKARFVNIIRDGRDVLASQLNTGDFKNSPSDLGKSWMSTHSKFRELTQSHPAQAFEIKYEDLVTDPAQELRTLTKNLGISFDHRMLNHTALNLTLYKAHHMSLDAIKAPINSTKIGRWKQDLTKKQIEEFLLEAEQGLIEHGYEL